VLRLLILKHIRNWSYAIVEREVRANLVCRDFTRVGRAKVADAKSMGRWGLTLGPEVIEQIHQRIVKIGQEHQILQGRQMRVDTTEVETNIWNPTDSSFLGDAVRVGTTLRDRSRRETTSDGDRSGGAQQRPASQQKLQRGYRRCSGRDNRGSRRVFPPVVQLVRMPMRRSAE
jgi:hypothetical protein